MIILLPILIPIIIGFIVLFSSFKGHIKYGNDYAHESENELKLIHYSSVITLIVSSILVRIASADLLIRNGSKKNIFVFLLV